MGDEENFGMNSLFTGKPIQIDKERSNISNFLDKQTSLAAEF